MVQEDAGSIDICAEVKNNGMLDAYIAVELHVIDNSATRKLTILWPTHIN